MHRLRRVGFGDRISMTDRPTHPRMGQSLLRLEDNRLLTGKGCFTGDQKVPACSHLAFCRSPVAAANIISIRTAAALAAPGVQAVYSGADLGHFDKLPINPVIAPAYLPDYPLLARRRLDAVGQAYAVVVATSPNAALDAAEQVELEYQTLDPQSDQSAQPGRDVFVAHWSDANFAAVSARGEFSVSVEIHHPRLAAVALETRSVLVVPDATTGVLQIELSSQTPHRARQHLAHILGLPEQQLQVRTADVGGAFGMKASLYPEEVLAVWIAQQLNCAVQWQATRNEDMLSATHGRAIHSKGTLVLDRHGRFLSLRAQLQCPLGHWLPNSAAVPAWNAARILPGPYRIEAVSIDTRATLSNTAAVGIYRGAGRPEAAMLMERLIDKAARKLNRDPLQLRKLNFIGRAELPLTRTTGARLDSGDYTYCLNELCEVAQIDELRQAVQQRRDNGELVGIGLACFVEPCGSGWESASLVRHVDGSLSASIGGSTQGHGRETACVQLLCDEFCLPATAVRIRHGDTNTCPTGIGALASRSTAIGGSALLRAARDIKQQLHDTPNTDKPLESHVVYTAEHEAWGSGYFIAQVAIDADTGHLTVEQMICVDEIGRVINPMLAEGQLHGGIAQGLGEATMEQMIYDDSGQLITGSLTDYALPRARDMPAIVSRNCQPANTATDANILAAKGIGESGTIGAPAAIVNAAIDALADRGVSDLQMPLSSEQIWRALGNAD